MGLFKSKAEREREKLERQKQKIENRLAQAKEMDQIREETRKLESRADNLEHKEFKDRVFETSIKLNQLEEKFAVKIKRETNTLRDRQARDLDATEAKHRLKNTYYSLVTVKRAKARLLEVQNDFEWSRTMRQLGGAMKTLNKISVGSEPLKRLLLQYRKAKMELGHSFSMERMEHYYGKSVDDLISDGEASAVANTNPIDLLVSDDVVENLLKNANAVQIEKFASEAYGVSVKPEEAANLAQSQSEMAASAGTEAVIDATPMSDDAFNAAISSWGDSF